MSTVSIQSSILKTYVMSLMEINIKKKKRKKKGKHTASLAKAT